MSRIRAKTDAFRAIADPSRRRMLAILEKEELPLNRIEASFRMSRPAALN